MLRLTLLGFYGVNNGMKRLHSKEQSGKRDKFQENFIEKEGWREKYR